MRLSPPAESGSNRVRSILEYYTPPADGSKAYTYINVDPVTKERQKNWMEDRVEKEIEDVRGKES